jgi:hypothetical protein
MLSKLLLATALVLVEATKTSLDLPSVKPRITYTKETVIKSARKLRNPLVRDTDCGKFCFFENDTDSWCISTTPPMVVVGWDIF